MRNLNSFTTANGATTPAGDTKIPASAEWWVINLPGSDHDGVHWTSSEQHRTDLRAIQSAYAHASMTYHGKGERGEVHARRTHSLNVGRRHQSRPTRRRDDSAEQWIAIACALVLCYATWSLCNRLVRSKDIAIALTIAAGATPFQIRPADRIPTARRAAALAADAAGQIAQLICGHAQVSALLIGLFFLARGERRPLAQHRFKLVLRRAGRKAHRALVRRAGTMGEPLSAPKGVVVAMPALPPGLGVEPPAPRADLLTAEQSQQLHVELLAGHDHQGDLPDSITKALIILDTGCATSMGNHEDQFERGSLYKADTQVIGVSGPMSLDKRGLFRLPVETDTHGLRLWKDKQGILNGRCPYVLLGIGRASIEKGATLYMPAGGADGEVTFPGGVRITVYNRNVLALRPIGYKVSPRKAPGPALTASEQTLGIPHEGAYVLYLGSGPHRDGDLADAIRELVGTSVTVVHIDTVIDPRRDLTKRDTVSAILNAVKRDGGDADVS